MVVEAFSDRVMKILLLGMGSIARKHATAIGSLVEDREYLIVRRSGRQDDYTRKLGASICNCIRDALAEEPDVALIASPTTAHYEAIDKLSDAKIPFYIEKPVVATLDEVHDLQQMMCQRKMPVTQSGYMLRHLPSLREVRQIISSGGIGRPVRAILEVGQWLPDWRPEQDYRESYSAMSDFGGGVILDLSHEIDMARYLFGEFNLCSGVALRCSSLEISSEDAASLVLARESGPIVSINLDYVARRLRRQYTIIGDEATLVWDLVDRYIMVDRPQGREIIHSRNEDFDFPKAFRAAWHELFAAMRGDAVVTQDMADALKSTELALKLKEIALQ